MTTNPADLSLRFHGTGSGGHPELGSSAATLEIAGQPALLIDCGFGTLSAFQEQYQRLPPALFISHCHMDHIADLEILSVHVRLQNAAPIPMFVPLSLLPTLHQRVATYPGALAEGGHDFWHSFQLLPVTTEFLLQHYSFRIYPTRHHAPGSSYALHLPGRFFYSGDTRPIPEILHHRLSGDERIFHDCGLVPNPSHTGLPDLEQEYQASVRERLVLYHYANESAGQALAEAGYPVAKPGNVFAIGSQS